MKRVMVWCLLCIVPVYAMDSEGDDCCALILSANTKRVVGVSAPEVISACSLLAKQFDLLDLDRMHGLKLVLVPQEEYASKRLWQKLTPCMEDVNNIQKLQSQAELIEVYTAANYFGHEELMQACADEISVRYFDFDFPKCVPMELQGKVSHALLKQYKLINSMISFGIKSIPVRIRLFECPDHDRDMVWACSLAQDGSVAIGRFGGDIYYWTKQKKGWQRGKIQPSDQDAGIGRVQFIKGTNRLVSSAENGGIKIWDLKTGNCVHAVGNRECNGFYSTYDQTRNRVAIGTEDYGIHIYSLEENQDGTLAQTDPVMILDGHTSDIYALDFSSKQEMLASVAEDEYLHLWNLATGDPIYSFELDASPRSVSFNHQGNLITVGLQNGTVQVFDAEQYSLVNEKVSAHAAEIWRSCFTPDDSLMFTGSQDKKIKIWAFPDLECLRTIKEGIGVLSFMDYQADLKKLIAGFSNAAITIDIDRILQEIHSHRIWLKYNLAVNKARFLLKAACATPQNPLVCDGKIGKIFNSFGLDARAQILQYFSVVLPDESGQVGSIKKGKGFRKKGTLKRSSEGK